MVYWNKSGAKRKGTGGKRAPYKTKSVELRGKTQSEPHVMKAFWQEHTMEDIITLTPEEIDIKIDLFLNKMETKRLKQDPSWWYPENIVIANFK
jgi:hypothetical protein